MSGEVVVTGTSFRSFEEATETAFGEVPGGYVSADVRRAWVTKGGFVGFTQFHVQLVSPARLMAVADVAEAVPGISCKDWSAWYNLMPPVSDPHLLRVTGTVGLPSSSIDVLLQPGNEGIGDDPKLLVLELVAHVPDFGDDLHLERTVSWVGRAKGIELVRIQGICSAEVEVTTPSARGTNSA